MMRDSLSEALEVSGTWAAWRSARPDIEWPSSLEDAAAWWRRDPGEGPYLLVAALAHLGSRRGGNEDTAALAVVVLLDRGIEKIAGQLEELWTVDDVRVAVWEVVKASEPQLGRCAPRYLLKRAHQRLVRAAGLALSADAGTGAKTISLEQLCAASPGHAGEVLGVAVSAEPDSAAHELAELLAWARTSGVIAEHEAELLTDLMTVCAVLPDGPAQEHLGSRLGVDRRSIRRRRALAVDRLRAAVPDYLAATA